MNALFLTVTNVQPGAACQYSVVLTNFARLSRAFEHNALLPSSMTPMAMACPTRGKRLRIQFDTQCRVFDSDGDGM